MSQCFKSTKTEWSIQAPAAVFVFMNENQTCDGGCLRIRSAYWQKLQLIISDQNQLAIIWLIIWFVQPHV